MNKIVIEQYIKNGMPDGEVCLAVAPNGEETPLPNMEAVINFLKKMHGYQIVRRVCTVQETTDE